MSVLDRLGAALAGRYAVERELGHGGMAYVFLGQDLKHHRPVAIKVFRPELAAALGAERFLREIEIAANLTHPHILPLLDSGSTEGILYYVMPYVEGESLRDRLDRETQLPVEEAIAITQQVASALAHAHSHDVIHRDIKPENILLQGDEVVVSDFGIARAITAAGGESLTPTGVAVGTPAYMSPEQAAKEPSVDGRSDVYSLACVLYEMLAGEPPYTGPSAQAILARRLTDPVPPLRTVRETVPVEVERTIARALAKVPADRYATALQFAEALAVGARAPQAGPGAPRRVAQALTAVLAVGLAVLAALLLRPSPPLAAVDPDLVAVFPFRVASSDAAIGYLREGLVDLLAVTLTGEGGPRAADPRAVLSTWERMVRSSGQDLTADDARRTAQRLGAGQFIDGSVVGSASRVVVTASLVPTTGGRAGPRAVVEGPLDSLPSLVDRLAAQLLVGRTGDGEPRLATLTPLPALRAYLEGKAAYRRGRWADAIHRFDDALRFDSTFALAALGLAEAWGWYSLGAPEREGAIRMAWLSRDHLSERDRATLEALAGPRYPASPSQAELLEARKRLVGIAPDRAEAWFQLGDQYYHWGRALGIAEAWERAVAAFGRAVELDSGFAGALEHLVWIAAATGDTGAVRRFGRLALTADSATGAAEETRWLMALAFGDSAALSSLRARLEHADRLVSIVTLAQESGLGMEDAESAAAALRRLPRAREEQQLVDDVLWSLALNRGRPGEALSISSRPVDRVLEALYWDGDTSAAARAAQVLARTGHAPPARDPEERGRQYRRLCVAEQWRLAHGDFATIDRSIARLRRAAVTRDSAWIVAFNTYCALLLEAWQATERGAPQAAPALERLDSMMLAWPPIQEVGDVQAIATNLVLARLREARGDLAGALAAVRRRLYGGFFPRYLSTYLREEGRLAALVGDTAGAIRAYRHYLGLRSDPEPTLRPEVERVRGELAKLVGEPRR